MTYDEIAAAWAMKGPLARESAFCVAPDQINRQTHLIADLRGERLSFVRAYRSVPLDPSDAQILEALDGMYREIASPPQPPKVVKVDG